MANKQQRKINRFVRNFNKNLAQDAFLGLNRFRLNHAERDGLHEWEVVYKYILVDTKTNEVDYLWVTNYNYQRELYWAMNNFIVKIRQREGW